MLENERTMIHAQEPGDIPKIFVESWNNRRVDLLASLFEEDADFINVVGLWWENRQAIYKAHDYGLKVIFNNSTLQVGKIKVKNLSDGIAVVHARMKLSGQTPLTDHAGVRHNLFTFVVRKKGDTWKCVSAQNTDIVAGAETNLINEKGELKPVDYRKN